MYPSKAHQKTKPKPKKTNSLVFQDPTLLHFNPIASPNLLSSTTTQSSNSPTVQSSLTPAFLSRFPRSLSSLSLGGKKKSTDKDAANSSLISQSTSVNTTIYYNHRSHLGCTYTHRTMHFCHRSRINSAPKPRMSN